VLSGFGAAVGVIGVWRRGYWCFGFWHSRAPYKIVLTWMFGGEDTRRGRNCQGKRR
jgi:hypothetical protein